MAQIAPFRGICFNPSRGDGLDLVVSPPYDVIDSTLQQRLFDRSSYNIVRLILGTTHDGDDAENNRYTRSAVLFQQWRDEQVLVRDEEPAIYLYDQHYQIGEQAIVRKGFIALARIEEFASGMVKPHEQTRFDWCRDRLQLLRHCRANFSPVFSLYSDPCCVVEAMTSGVRKETPDLEVSDDQGVRHKLWKIHDRRLIMTISDVLDAKPLLIADGHHRYETALNYRDEQREKQGEFSGKETFNYISMYFSNMEDPSCQTVAQHRLISARTYDPFWAQATTVFNVVALQGDAWQERVDQVPTPGDGHDMEILLYVGNGKGYVLTLKDLEEQSQRYRHLLVHAPSATHRAILYRAVLEQLLCDVANEEDGGIVHQVADALTCVDQGVARGALLFPALSVATVRDIANAGGKIPECSTCFFPSVLSGLVINPIVSGEQIGDFL